MNSLLLLLIAVPALEIFVFIKVGGIFGALNTILLIITTAVVGIYFAKLEGLNTIKSGIAAGIFATTSYAIVVWGMQFIEIAYVSSIREISIVFAAIIGMIFLFESNAKSRILPSILIVSGISVVYFQIL